MLSRCFLDFSLGVGAFVIGLSQISSFFSSCKRLPFGLCFRHWHCVEQTNVILTVLPVLKMVMFYT